MSVAINLVIKRIGEAPFWLRGRTRTAEIDSNATKLVNQYNITTPSIHTHAGSLSGGNAQKVVLSRELSFDPRVVVFNKPTYGLDVKTTRRCVRASASWPTGTGGALLISTDLEELLVSATVSRCCPAVVSPKSSRISRAELEIGGA